MKQKISWNEKNNRHIWRLLFYRTLLAPKRVTEIFSPKLSVHETVGPGKFLRYELRWPWAFGPWELPDGKSGPLRGLLPLTEDRSRKGPNSSSSFISSCLNLLLYFKWSDSDPSTVSSCVNYNCHFLHWARAIEAGARLMGWGWASGGGSGHQSPWPSGLALG